MQVEQDMSETEIKSFLAGKKGKKFGEPPAILLISPKYARNIGTTVRAASCYGIKQVWYTGDRVELDEKSGKRLPREERMKGFRDVEIIQNDYPFDQFEGVVPVAIEVRQNSESLVTFEHPDNALYVFGPEDGSIPKQLGAYIHRFVVIPTRHCLNLATAVATVLYDRQQKRILAGKEPLVTPGEWEGRDGKGKGMERFFDEQGQDEPPD
jgi:tRNA(Leu) C34 or U34 (ribose-2'-O)-methylase TrmL